MSKVVRIGGASAFWGDTNTAAAQLLQKGNIDYIVFDYLAEITMSILAAKRMKDPNDGYATDFVEHVMAPLMPELQARGVKVIANAGGVNPLACKAALEAAATKAGVTLKIAVVLGDDLVQRKKEFNQALELDTGKSLPATVLSLNAYLGAVPIAEALRAGADVVITGRCVDSAVTLGPLMYEFGWAVDDYDHLAAGSLAGHIIECGAQCTGGNFTDWQLVPGYDDMGFPVIECHADGSFVVTKPEGTGGLVSVHTVGEQMLYEIGNPHAYLLPDVSCDFTQVTLTAVGKNRVAVRGAKGLPPTDTYKVSATHPAGMRCCAVFMIGGIDAAKKGHASADAILAKVRRQLLEQNLGDFTGVDVHCVGAEESYGPHARAGAKATREVLVKIVVQHPNPKALRIFGREIAQAATGMAPGFTGYFSAGRPEAHMIPKLFSTLLPKAAVRIEVAIGEQRFPVAVPVDGGYVAAVAEPIEDPIIPDCSHRLPLICLALARSGDKGDHANIGVLARKPEYLPYIQAALTPEAVAHYFAHLAAEGQPPKVQRWNLPGSHSLNFLMLHVLAGGGAGSVRTDPQGKFFSQMLLEYPIPVPASVAAECGG